MYRNRFTLTMIVIVSMAGSVFSWGQPAKSVLAQAERNVECGEIIESEFTEDLEEHIYVLTMKPKDSFAVSVETVGNFLEMGTAIYGPTGLQLGTTGWTPSSAPSIESGILSARGSYKIQVANGGLSERSGQIMNKGGVGIYTLSISCTIDGQAINAGDIAQPTPTPAPLPTATPRSALPEGASIFTGIGFPGLAPVDFADAVTVPLLLDEKMTGVIPLDNQILGFTLDAQSGDLLDLTYTRSSGNMNLGLVVLSENNEVFFQASLVTSESLSTHFTLPEAGQYTIGVFRISMVEPDTVKPTVFQLQVKTTVE